jgi:hypothetical protein
MREQLVYPSGSAPRAPGFDPQVCVMSEYIGVVIVYIQYNCVYYCETFTNTIILYLVSMTYTYTPLRHWYCPPLLRKTP